MSAIEQTPEEEPTAAPQMWLDAYHDPELALAEYKRSLATEERTREAAARRRAEAPRVPGRFSRAHLDHPGLR